jgi:hypothetical protein
MFNFPTLAEAYRIAAFDALQKCAVGVGEVAMAVNA